MSTANQNQDTPAANQPRYDIVIIGGGPAGLTAAIYAARDKLSVLIVERAVMGGLITETERIDNYPGFVEGASGFELTDKMLKQAQKYGARDTSAEAVAIERSGVGFLVRTAETAYPARTVIVAGGSHHLKLGIPGEKEYTGRGVSYCATCDAPFYANKIAAVAGGGDTAIYEAIHLAKFAGKVYLVHRRGEYRAAAVMQEAAKNNPKIEHLLDTAVEAIEGGDFVDKLRLRHVPTGKASELTVDGIFVAVGLKPNTEYLKGLLKLDSNDAVIVDANMATSVSGIFAAGDIRHGSIRQVVAAAGDGAVAALSAKRWLDEV